jgi:hypothetical protein
MPSLTSAEGWSSAHDSPISGIQPVRLGFNGYWLQELINHEINSVAVLNSKERILGREASKEFVGPSDLCLPQLQPEGYISCSDWTM